MAILGFFLKRLITQTDNRFIAVSQEVDAVRRETATKFVEVEKDVRKLGDVIREEVKQLREEANASRNSVTQRLDTIITSLHKVG